MTTYGLAAGLVAVVFYILFFGRCVQWWVIGRSRADVSLGRLMLARLRGADPRVLVEARLLARAGRVDIPIDAMELQHLARADVIRVLAAVIAARRAQIDLDFDEACLWDREHGNPLDLLQRRQREQHHALWTAAQNQSPEELRRRIGARGDVAARVSPAGIILLDGQPVFATSTEGILEPGAPVEVIDVQGHVAVVQPPSERRTP